MAEKERRYPRQDSIEAEIDLASIAAIFASVGGDIANERPEAIQMAIIEQAILKRVGSSS